MDRRAGADRAHLWGLTRLLIGAFLGVGVQLPAQAADFLDWNVISSVLPSWPISDIGPEINPALIEQWKTKNSYKCPKGPGYRSYASKKDDEWEADCNDLDTNLFLGLLCAAGDNDSCRSVKEAQAPNGEWYRSPRNRYDGTHKCLTLKNTYGSFYCRDCANTFSADVGLGTILYIIKSKDRTALRSWFNAIERMGQENRLCKDGTCEGFKWARICSNDAACVAVPDAKNSKAPLPLLGYTGGSCMLVPYNDAPDYDFVAKQQYMNKGALLSRATDNDLLLFAILSGILQISQIPAAGGLPIAIAATPPEVRKNFFAQFTATNFPLHLEATRVFIRMLAANPEMKIKNLPRLPPDPDEFVQLPGKPLLEGDPALLHQHAVEIARRQEWNPYYGLLAYGPTNKIGEDILRLCPLKDEEIPINKGLWRWETDVVGEQGKEHSMGWDCVFVGLLYNKMRVKEDYRKELFDLWSKYADPVERAFQDADKAFRAQVVLAGQAQDSLDAALAEEEAAKKFRDSGYATAKNEIDKSLAALRKIEADASDAVNRFNKAIIDAGQPPGCPPPPTNPPGTPPWVPNPPDPFGPCRATLAAYNAAVAAFNQLTNALAVARNDVQSKEADLAKLGVDLAKTVGDLNSGIFRRAVTLNKAVLNKQQELLAEQQRHFNNVHAHYEGIKGNMAVWTASKM